MGSSITNIKMFVMKTTKYFIPTTHLIYSPSIHTFDDFADFLVVNSKHVTLQKHPEAI